MSKLYRKAFFSDSDHDSYVFPHLMAMTEERLNSKYDIAVELASRDKQISLLKKEISLLKANRALNKELSKELDEQARLKHANYLKLKDMMR